jgi:hypothetical protein
LLHLRSLTPAVSATFLETMAATRCGRTIAAREKDSQFSYQVVIARSIATKQSQVVKNEIATLPSVARNDSI